MENDTYLRLANLMNAYSILDDFYMSISDEIGNSICTVFQDDNEYAQRLLQKIEELKDEICKVMNLANKEAEKLSKDISREQASKRK